LLSLAFSDALYLLFQVVYFLSLAPHQLLEHLSLLKDLRRLCRLLLRCPLHKLISHYAGIVKVG